MDVRLAAAPICRSGEFRSLDRHRRTVAEACRGADVRLRSRRVGPVVITMSARPGGDLECLEGTICPPPSNPLRSRLARLVGRLRADRGCSDRRRWQAGGHLGRVGTSVAGRLRASEEGRSLTERCGEAGVEEAVDRSDAVASNVKHVDGERSEGVAVGRAEVVDHCWSTVR